ncbi:MAG: UDP-3-O-(3-hydroxymyristoyl)glucosamine N-acyltransferase [Phycisphaerae bacterium]|jgi:UDP-3-O-[3-hydroxymyristoyl] glucosamine N-acyltransferase
MARTYNIAELATIVGGTPRDQTGAVITGVADIAEATPEQATWLSNPKYASHLSASHAGVVLVPADFGQTPMPAILCDRVDAAVAKLLAAFAPPVPPPQPGMHPTAVVHESAAVGDDCSIGPHVVIEPDARVSNGCVLHAGVFVGHAVTIGRDCLIWPNVVIRDGSTLGNRVIIHPCAVIGADGFGFYFDENRHNKIPHIGGVIIEDDVEIGACSCIDRSKFGHTVIGRGSKIDNLVQLAHNVRVGEHCVFAGQTGISGSTRIGNHCIFGARAGTLDNLTLGDGVVFTGGGTIVDKNFPPGTMLSGFPAQDHRQELRERAQIRRLPKMAEQLKELIARVKQLEESADH